MLLDLYGAVHKFGLLHVLLIFVSTVATVAAMAHGCKHI